MRLHFNMVSNRNVHQNNSLNIMYPKIWCEKVEKQYIIILYLSICVTDDSLLLQVL